ncbi:hypothetical protein [Veronia nyctiphanis]|nr:hypothetical protein [Veronia nyctiphanis]
MVDDRKQRSVEFIPVQRASSLFATKITQIDSIDYLISNQLKYGDFL